jgi:hypothetical protein
MFVCSLVSVFQLPSGFCFWILTPTLLSQSVVPSVVFTLPLTLMCPESDSDTVRSCSAPVPVTVKFVELVAVPLGVVTEIGPVVAPEGTVALIRVAFCTVKVVAETPLKRTAVAPVKFVPLIWTEVPIGPLVGLNDVIVGAPVVVTVKFVELVAVPSGLVTAIGPVVAPDGTVDVIFCALSIVNVADVPLKVTLVTFGPLKLWPWIVTEVPTGPLAGENEVIVGAAARAASAPGRTTRITVSNTVDVT